MAQRSVTTGDPLAYARAKLPVMRARWEGAAGAYVRAFAPAIWPATPAQALLGVTANSMGPTEDVTAGAPFRAIGLYQVPGGPAGYPANSRPGAPHNAWLDRIDDPRVTNLLGREAVTLEWATHIEDQVAIGLANLRDDLAATLSSLRARGAPTSTTNGSQWQLAVAIMGYVVGPSGAAALLASHTAALSAVPERARFGALVRRLADGAPSARWGYPVVRCWQRLATGAELARVTGGPTGWFDLGLGADTAALAHAVAEAAYGGSDSTGLLVGLAALAMAAGGAYLAWPEIARRLGRRRARRNPRARARSGAARQRQQPQRRVVNARPSA